MKIQITFTCAEFDTLLQMLETCPVVASNVEQFGAWTEQSSDTDKVALYERIAAIHAGDA